MCNFYLVISSLVLFHFYSFHFANNPTQNFIWTHFRAIVWFFDILSSYMNTICKIQKSQHNGKSLHPNNNPHGPTDTKAKHACTHRYNYNWLCKWSYYWNALQLITIISQLCTLRKYFYKLNLFQVSSFIFSKVSTFFSHYITSFNHVEFSLPLVLLPHKFLVIIRASSPEQVDKSSTDATSL